MARAHPQSCPMGSVIRGRRQARSPGSAKTIVRYGSAIPRITRMTIALTCNIRARLKVNPLSRNTVPWSRSRLR